VPRRPYLPPPESTVHLIGDVHIGGISPHRCQIVLDDLDKEMVPTTVAHIQLGDMTDLGTPEQDALALEWLKQLDAPWYNVLGNHDNFWRDASEWAAVYGWPSQNYTADLGFAKLIAVGPGEPSWGKLLRLSEETLRWLDQELTAAHGTDCIIACHAPLAETVLGDDDIHYTSRMPEFQIHDNEAILEVLAAHPNAKAWISGHTHSPIEVPDLITTKVVGGHKLAAINTSALYYVGKRITWTAPLITLYLTWLGDRAEVRFRNHGAGVWDGPHGLRVVDIDLS
jgi:3',5'-cyclic AMP phosphodiesterase CpdA